MDYENKYLWKIKFYFSLFLFILFNIYTAKSELISSAYKEKSKLLIVHSFEDTFSDYPALNKLIEKGLKHNKISADTQTFYLDCDAYDRDGEIERINHLLDTISVKPDLILVTDDQATYSLLASKHPLLKMTPIIFSGVNFPNWSIIKEYTNITGIWDNPDYEKNAEMIEKVMGVKRIRFFYDKTYVGKKVIARLAEQYKDKDKELYESLTPFLQKEDSINNIENQKDLNVYLRGNDYDQRPLETSFHFINMWDEKGRDLLWNISGSFRYSVFLLAKYDYSTANVGRLATVPTFSATNKGFTQHMDILGGYFTPLEDQVKATCDYIAQVLNGKDISQLPIKEVEKKYVIDWAVLNRWSIPVKNIPKGIEIVNMPIYIKYQTAAIVCLSVFLITIIFTISYLLFLYFREVKRKRLAQIHLREEKEFLSLSMEGTNIFAWRFDSENNQFCFEKEFADYIGISSTTIKLEKLSRITHPDDQEYALNSFIKIVNKIEDRGNIRARINFNDQGYLWYEFRVLNISDVLKHKSTVIGLLMNIQDFKDKEEELITARDLASKAELKQSFLANMSHEIRTPLNSIIGFTNMLVSDEELPNDERLEYIHIINKNCELLLKLINDILELSRIESGNVSLTIDTYDLRDIVEDVYSMCKSQTPTDVEFIKNIPPTPLLQEVDSLRLKQVLVNFISNAFKFTSAGYVAIGIEIDETNKEILIYVEDTGEGIPEEHQKMIFDRFYKVNEFAQGTGLGLSICQVIVNKLNGRITLSSEVGKGSRFGIVFTCTEKQDMQTNNTEKQESVQESSNEYDENRPVILIAEDSVSNYMLLKNILKKSFNIFWALNGKDALEIIKKQKIDLILMDIKMNEMDGITALTKLRKSHKKLPVIIQTAYAFEENRKMAQQAGASGFISKPITPDILLSAINDFIVIK